MTQLVKASQALAEKHGLEPAMLIETVKQQCFPTLRPENISDAQCAMFLSVCHTQDLNPFIPGMVYAYPTKSGGITPVIGPDGVFKKLAERKEVSYECEVFPENITEKPTHAKASIYVEGKERPYTFTAVFSEWSVSSNPNWSTRPRHMIWVRALKQCARQVIHGLPMDDDEVVLAGLKNVTGTGDEVAADTPAPKREAPPKRERGVAAAAAAAEKKGSTAAPAEQASAAIEVAATVVAETAKPAEPAVPVSEPVKPVETAKPVEKEPAKPEKKAEPKPAPAPATTAAPAPTTKLADGQRITFERVEIERFAKKPVNGQPSIEAELKGAYTGKVYHIGGAENPAWQIEKPVAVTLVGKKLTSGVVITLVEKLEVSSGGDAVELF